MAPQRNPLLGFRGRSNPLAAQLRDSPTGLRATPNPLGFAPSVPPRALRLSPCPQQHPRCSLPPQDVAGQQRWVGFCPWVGPGLSVRDLGSLPQPRNLQESREVGRTAGGGGCERRAPSPKKKTQPWSPARKKGAARSRACWRGTAERCPASGDTWGCPKERPPAGRKDTTSPTGSEGKKPASFVLPQAPHAACGSSQPRAWHAAWHLLRSWCWVARAQHPQLEPSTPSLQGSSRARQNRTKAGEKGSAMPTGAAAVPLRHGARGFLCQEPCPNPSEGERHVT